MIRVSSEPDLDSDISELICDPCLPPERVDVWRRWIDETSGHDGHLFLPTSGISGPSKLVAISRNAIRISARSVCNHLEMTRNDVSLLAIPPHHVGGIGLIARANEAGSRICRMGFHSGRVDWSPAGFVEIANTHGATLCSLVPTQIHDLVRAGCRAPGRLRAVVVGGARLREELYMAAIRLGWPLLASYGMTETASQIATAPLASAGKDFQLPQILPHAEVGVNDDILRVRSKSLFTGYIEADGGPARLRNLRTKDDWFETGDRGEIVILQGRQCVKVFGRESDYIKIYGERVDLDELEKLLRRCASRMGLDTEAIAIGYRDDPRRGTAPVLLLRSEQIGGLSGMALLTAYNSECAPLARIDPNDIRPIRLSSLGKIIRKQGTETGPDHPPF